MENNEKKQPEMVTITKREYDELLERSEWLGYLESAGVDNWCGYDEAASLQREDRREKNKKEAL